MRRLATVALSLLLSVAALYSSVTPAAACRCLPITETEAVRDAMEFHSLVVEGVIAAGQGDVAAEHVRFQPEVLYAGDVSGEIVLDQTWEQAQPYADSDAYAVLGGDCSYSLIGDPGDRYVLFLRAVGGGRYAPAGCTSFVIGEIEALPYESLQQRYDAIKLISDGGTVVGEALPEDVPVSSEDSGGDVPAAQPGEAPPQDEPAEPNESTPWAIILPIAFAIPLAVLVVPALLLRRGGR